MPTIDAIDINHYRLPLDPPFHASWDPQPRTSFTSTLVRVRAGEFEGVGSGDQMLGFAGHEQLFIGRDPFEIERHVRLLDNLQFHYGRMWPLEVALWDLMGKISGQPLWRLLGGRRLSVKPYASTGSRQPAEEKAALAVRLQQLGYKALKLRFHAADPREDLVIAQTVRDAVGPRMNIMVDANQGWQMPWDDASSWDYKTALWMADALAEVDCYWLEEPLHRHDYRGMANLRQAAKIRIAGGEGNREYGENRQLLAHGSLDVYQQDAVWSTGIWRGRQLAAEVEAAGCIYSPHTWGDGLALLANLHLTAGVGNAPYLEFPIDPPAFTPTQRDFILPHPIMPDHNGDLTLSDDPGLGIEIRWNTIERYRV